MDLTTATEPSHPTATSPAPPPLGRSTSPAGPSAAPGRREPTAPPGRRDPTDRPGRLRRLLRVVAIVACLPYVALKVAWIAGSRVGIPDGSPLLDGDHHTALVAVNALTVLMDVGVVVLALAFTQRWGRRLPAWLLVLPAWIATGLLGPIVVAFPAQTLLALFSATPASGAAQTDEPFLADWVFGVVYGGFLVQALALGTLFVAYAADRWGAWVRGPLAAGAPASGASRPRTLVAGGCAALSALPLLAHLLWATGSDLGLSESRIDGRDRDFSVVEVTHAGFALALAVGVLLLTGVLGRTGRRPVAGPAPATGGRRVGRHRERRLWPALTAAWAGSAAVACWGGWLLMAAVVTDSGNMADAPLMNLTYAVQVTTGSVAFLLCSRLLVARAVGARRHQE